MTHTYQITGMTCSGCEAKVKRQLLSVPDIAAAEISRDNNTAIITMDRHVGLSELQQALGGTDSKYQISEIPHSEDTAQERNWLAAYSPILLIFLYILGITSFVQINNTHFDWMQWMRHFMAGFFLVFSFFKMLNLKGFAESYVMYDVLARRFPPGLISMLSSNWVWVSPISLILIRSSQTGPHSS